MRTIKLKADEVLKIKDETGREILIVALEKSSSDENELLMLCCDGGTAYDQRDTVRERIVEKIIGEQK